MQELSNTKQEVLYKAVIPLDPKTKKNNLQIRYRQGKGGYAVPFISQGDMYLQYERDCAFFVRTPKEPIGEKVNVRCIFYRQKATRVDLNNLLECATDILVKYGVLADDNFKVVAGHDGSRVYIDRNNPRTEIYIERWEED